MVISLQIAPQLLNRCCNGWTSYRHKFPIAVLKISLKQSQSGFQIVPGAIETFLNRDLVNLLIVNTIRLQKTSRGRPWVSQRAGKGKIEENSFHNVPKGFQETQNQVHPGHYFP
jgi:hypothetical protein